MKTIIHKKLTHPSAKVPPKRVHIIGRPSSVKRMKTLPHHDDSDQLHSLILKVELSIHVTAGQDIRVAKKCRLWQSELQVQYLISALVEQRQANNISDKSWNRKKPFRKQNISAVQHLYRGFPVFATTTPFGLIHDTSRRLIAVS